MKEMTIKEQFEFIKNHPNLPRHIAIIMDGNGRWARERNLPRIAGHREGINSVREVTRECGKLGVKYLTLYTFSKENWFRPASEVSALMELLLITIRQEVKELNKNNVKLNVIGKLEDLPEEPRQGMIEGMELTRKNTGLNLNLALSYSGRIEIIDAVKRIGEKLLKGELSLEEINTEMFSNYLYTAGMPDPDLLIRTSGETRISNFLLWQLAYTELVITPTYWPAFRKRELYAAIIDYLGRERRFGRVSEQLQNDNKN